MDKLRELIAQLEQSTTRSDMEENLLKALQEKKMELELSAQHMTEEEIDDIVGSVVAEQLVAALSGGMIPDGENDSDMEQNLQVVRDIFREMDLNYQEYTHQKGVQAFMLNMVTQGRKLHVKVYLESFPKVCRIDAVYPFVSDPAFIYPLCEKMLKENAPRRFGALQYDERDGELSYRYSFPITHGLHEDDFRTIFMAVLASADSSFETLRQYAVGRFRRDQRTDITCKAQQLIIELDQ